MSIDLLVEAKGWLEVALLPRTTSEIHADRSYRNAVRLVGLLVERAEKAEASLAEARDQYQGLNAFWKQAIDNQIARAETAERELAEAWRLLERLVTANWNCPDPDCTGEGLATGPGDRDFKPHSAKCQTGAFLAARPAPADLEEHRARMDADRTLDGVPRADPAPRCRLEGCRTTGPGMTVHHPACPAAKREGGGR